MLHQQQPRANEDQGSAGRLLPRLPRPASQLPACGLPPRPPIPVPPCADRPLSQRADVAKASRKNDLTASSQLPKTVSSQKSTGRCTNVACAQRTAISTDQTIAPARRWGVAIPPGGGRVQGRAERRCRPCHYRCWPCRRCWSWSPQRIRFPFRPLRAAALQCSQAGEPADSRAVLIEGLWQAGTPRVGFNSQSSRSSQDGAHPPVPFAHGFDNQKAPATLAPEKTPIPPDPSLPPGPKPQLLICAAMPIAISASQVQPVAQASLAASQRAAFAPFRPYITPRRAVGRHRAQGNGSGESGVGEDVIARLRAAEEEAQRLKKELAAAQAAVSAHTWSTVGVGRRRAPAPALPPAWVSPLPRLPHPSSHLAPAAGRQCGSGSCSRGRCGRQTRLAH